MEESNNSMSMLDFDSPKEQASYIKVVGVGGGGGNAVNNMYEKGIKGVDFVICNTDTKALNSSPVPYKIALGHLGAGNKPEVAHAAAVAHKDEIRAALENGTEMLFITAGMGGGTGTGAAPVIAEIAKEIKLEDPDVSNILVVAVVTSPFSFEGKKRRDQAAEGIKELRKHVDSILVVNNDKLRGMGNLPMNEAFKCADDVLLSAVKGIAEIITANAYVNVDFHDVNTVMSKSGTALMGTGLGKGENRAQEAIEQASTSVLLNDNDISGAKNVLLYFTYPANKQITMDEIGIITDYVIDHTRLGEQEADVIWGAGIDESLNDELKITLIATGFSKDKSAEEGKKVIPLGEPSSVSKPIALTPQPVSPEAAIASQATPVAAPTETPASKGHIYQLDDEEIKPTTVNATQPRENTSQPAAPVADTDGIVLVHKEVPVAVEQPSEHGQSSAVEVKEMAGSSQQVANPTPMAVATAPAPSAAPAPAWGDPVSARAERLQRARRLNALLHNDPDGPRKVEEMTTAQLSNEPIYAAPHSSESEANQTTVSPDGQMVERNNFLYNRPD